MNTTLLDNLSIADLQSRYGLSSRTSVYTRLKALGITPDKGRINADQLEKMDELDKRLQAGEPMPSPCLQLEASELSLSTKQSGEQFSLSSEQPVSLYVLLKAIELLTQSLKEQPHPLLPQRVLQEAWERGYLLSTSQLKEIIGRSPKVGEVYGFRLVKVGRSGVRGESGWRVER